MALLSHYYLYTIFLPFFWKKTIDKVGKSGIYLYQVEKSGDKWGIWSINTY